MSWTVQRFVSWMVLAVTLLLVRSGGAEVTRWEITKREPYAGGKPIGERGPCERWTGVVHFAIDPRVAANAQIVDLSLASANAEGKVEFWVEFYKKLAELNRAWSNVKFTGWTAEERLADYHPVEG